MSVSATRLREYRYEKRESRTAMARCEWNAYLNRPGQDPARPTDCDQEARWSVGTGKRNIHLCEGCAKLPHFRRLTKRVRLNREAPTHDMRERFDVACDSCGDDDVLLGKVRVLEQWLCPTCADEERKRLDDWGRALVSASR